MDTVMCGVVIEKSGNSERFCTHEARFVIPLTADDDTTLIDAIPLCELHSDRFDGGASMVVKTRKDQRVLIRIELTSTSSEVILSEQDVASHPAPSSLPPADTGGS